MSYLRQLVFDALSNADANGYEELIRRGNEEDVALDLLDCDSEIAARDPSIVELIPLVREWRASLAIPTDTDTGDDQS